MLLHQAAHALLRPLAFLERLAVRARHLSLLVPAANGNVDALELALLQLADHLARIEPIGLHLQPRGPFHAARRNHRHGDLLCLRPPRDLVPEPARLEGQVHRAARVLRDQRLQVRERGRRGQPALLLPAPAYAIHPLRAREIDGDLDLRAWGRTVRHGLIAGVLES